VSYGQEINFNNLYSKSYHPTEIEANANPFHNTPKDDIFLVKVWPKKEKVKYKPKVYIFRVNFIFKIIGKKKTNTRC
jgi:hypothetical protein